MLQRYGQLLLNVGRLDEAEPLLREADGLVTAIRQGGKKPNSRHFTSTAQREYATLLLRRNKKGDAEMALARALDTSAWCADGELAELTVRIMLVLMSQQRHGEAAALADKLFAQPANANRAQLFQARYFHAVAVAALNN